MKISSSFNIKEQAGTVCKSEQGCSEKLNKKNNQSFKGRRIYLPDCVGEVGKWTNEYVSLPEQKLILASTAVLFQPIVDVMYAEEDKKYDAAIKSASKAIAGGITGVTIRALFEKYFNSKIQIGNDGFEIENKVSTYLFPENAKLDYRHRYWLFGSPSESVMELRKYCSTLAGIASILVMTLVTNEKIDVPLTFVFQDLFTDVVKNDKTWIEAFQNLGNSYLKKAKLFLIYMKEYIRETPKLLKELLTDDRTQRMKRKKAEKLVNEKYL